MAKKVTVLIIGAGMRGRGYSVFALDFPDEVQVVGVADIRQFYRERLQREQRLSDKFVFSDWKDAAAKDKFADCVFVCTPDRLHKEVAVAFASKGYHILLEKPMAVTEEDCKEIVETCKKFKVLLAVCHVLRYTPQAQKIKEIIDSGRIGDIVNIQLLEPVGYWHFAHSYVRGNWRNTSGSAFSLLTKSCHDIDLLLYWKSQSEWKMVSSFGSLKHFNVKNKPAGAASRCLDCAVERSCPYSAKKIYLDSGTRSWPTSVITEVPDIESVTQALKTGPYGRCVYECDNNVCDNQVVNIQFEDGSTASFSMIAFTEKVCQRQVKVFGTKGEIKCDFSYLSVTEYSFVDGDIIEYDLSKDFAQCHQSRLKGHGGADFFALKTFIEAVASGDSSKILTGPEASFASHQLCFKAERSRLENTIVQNN